MTCPPTGDDLTESGKDASSASATGATDGGISSSTDAQREVSTDGAEPASSAKESDKGESIRIDGWDCSDANPFLHAFCRSVTAPDGDWPICLVLTAGDDVSESTRSIVIPPAVLLWLLTGEVPSAAR